MRWEDHRSWSRKLGISDEVSRYVDRIIDISDKDQLPPDYVQSVEDSAEEIAANRGAKGNSALVRVIAENTIGHDSGRQKTTRGSLAAESILRFLRSKEEDYVTSWHLHHYLDYLHENRNSEKTFEELATEFRNECPKPHSQRIEDFLREHKEELVTELDLSE